jgi:hypothetical protein
MPSPATSPAAEQSGEGAHASLHPTPRLRKLVNHFIHVGPAGGYIGRISWSNSGYMDCRWGAVIWRQCSAGAFVNELLNEAMPSSWWGSIGIIRYLMRCP